MEKRQVNIESLRLLLMLMVVILHMFGHTILNYPMQESLKNFVSGYKNVVIANIIESLCIAAVDCFILISGYFSIKLKSFKIMKILLLMMEYRLGIYLLFVILDLETFSIIGLLKYILPLQWWFMQYYLFLVAASPLLNWIIENISKKGYQILLLEMFIFFSFIPTVSRFSFTNDRGQGCINFIFMYFIGAYIRKYPVLKIKNLYLILLYLTNCGFMIFGNALIHKELINDVGWTARLWGYDTFFVQINAILLFFIFKELKIKNQGIIADIVRKCAKGSLAVYIIHEHVLIRDYIFKSNFSFNKWMYVDFFVPLMLGLALGIYVICLLIELIRQKLLENLENSLWQILYIKIITPIFSSKNYYKLKEKNDDNK